MSYGKHVKRYGLWEVGSISLQPIKVDGSYYVEYGFTFSADPTLRRWRSFLKRSCATRDKLGYRFPTLPTAKKAIREFCQREAEREAGMNYNLTRGVDD